MQFQRNGDQWYLVQTQIIPRAWDALFRAPGIDYSHLTKTEGGRQWRPSYLSDVERQLQRWTNPELRRQGLPLLKQRHDCWLIDYEPKGYQQFHSHGQNLITQILYFTDDSSRTELEIGDHVVSLDSRRGQLVTISGTTKHRGTAVDHRKRVMVVDWQI